MFTILREFKKLFTGLKAVLDKMYSIRNQTAAYYGGDPQLCCNKKSAQRLLLPTAVTFDRDSLCEGWKSSRHLF